MTIKEIDRKTPEGRLLWAALIVLTTSPELHIAGETVRGSATQPDDMLAKLEDLADLEDKLTPAGSTPWPVDPALNISGRILG